jgi:hypothetical protein
MERRIAERRRRSGRWLNADPAPRQAPVQQQTQQTVRPWWLGEQLQPLEQSPQPQQQLQVPPLQRERGWQQMEEPAGSPPLGAFARGGMQRKISRFAETVNSLRRAQQERGAIVSWGRQEGSVEAPTVAHPSSLPPQQASASWEEQLGVTRVQRGATISSDGAGESGMAAAGRGGLQGAVPIPAPDPAAPPLQRWSAPSDGRRAQQAGAAPALDSDEQLDW